ncbi:hypothetical protein OSB04_007229 [Centaurea solstitialis]|uniref:Reverse transcriptase domain-containing protein n=1 Tax=Centaurea solstitialis TaxID=347529 RepID=A0AA38WSG7_9ASTR|nr:hypothetical protein OSB04_007229 [Centaurea solstitialis]
MELIHKIFDIEKKNLLDIKQKARINWAINGDENSKYFHSSLKYKQRKNHIHGLSLDGDWITDPLKLKSFAFDFFADKYKEPLASRPSFICQRFKKLSELHKEFLEGQFTEAEIKKAVWGCDGDKAQGPDGFTFSFIKKFWSIIGQGFVDAVNHFGNSKKLDKCANSSFLSLIPKIRDPIYLLDYRPISLIGCLYKIIAKVLSNRLKEVISSVIGVEQTAFLKNRSILDGPLIINETISWIKRSKKKAFILKVDFQKAFDTLNWNYLDMVMGQMNFGSTWRAWIRSCLDSSRVSVLVNGSPSHEFSMFRGIRQGDPLAPFLFLIAAEGLNVALLEAIDGNVFQGINLPHGGPIISHLQYADDAIFIGNWSEDNALNLLSLLRCFYMSSGLMVNLSKTVLMGVGVNSDEVVNLANLLNCSSGSLPFNYLGFPVGASMNKCSHWQPILDKFQSKLSSWKAPLLSCGGRITLCKSVLRALGVYYFSLYKAPIKDVISPMEFGGLGVGSLRSLNLALLAKWCWRLKTDRAALWNKLHVYRPLKATLRTRAKVTAKVPHVSLWMGTLAPGHFKYGILASFFISPYLPLYNSEFVDSSCYALDFSSSSRLHQWISSIWGFKNVGVDFMLLKVLEVRSTILEGGDLHGFIFFTIHPPLLKVLQPRVFTQDLEEGLRPSIYTSVNDAMLNSVSRNAPMSPALGLLLGVRASDDVAMLNSGHRVFFLDGVRLDGYCNSLLDYKRCNYYITYTPFWEELTLWRIIVLPPFIKEGFCLLQFLGCYTWSAISSVNSTLVDFNLDLNLLIHPQYDDSSNEPVSWRWDLDGSGLFSVSSLRMALENKLFFREGDSKTIWLNPLPSKVNIFIWKLQNERLPTLANLSRRGINLPSLLCHFCGLETETEQHLFCSCPIIRASLEEFRAWWGVRWPILL